MILTGRNAKGAEVLLDALALPNGGNVVGDFELNTLASARPEVARRWIAARVAAWREAHSAR